MIPTSQANVKLMFKTQTQLGEEVRVVGNIESFGMWKPSEGIVMKADPFTSPYWSTVSPLSIPLGIEVEYKYVYIYKDQVRWEQIQGNRKFHAVHTNLTIEDEENSTISKLFLYDNEAPKNLPRSLEPEAFAYDEKLKYEKSDTILIISNSLPIKIVRNENYVAGQPLSEKWIINAHKGVWQTQLYRIALAENIKFHWIGCPGIWLESDEEQEELTQFLIKEYKCIPMFIPPIDAELHYEFCSKILHRIFHGVIETNSEMVPQYSREMWEGYKRVNILFADLALKYYSHTLVWVHGHQLMLVPSFLSRKTNEILNIGFFLHIPFPSSEIYRVLPHREAILHALCCCDLIGFHLFDYARHFIGTCKRMIGVDIEFSKGGFLGLNYYGRHIMIKVGHLGVEPNLITLLQNSENYQSVFQELTSKYLGKKLILNIDPCHQLSGIYLKLKAFQNTMRCLPQKKNRIIFLQILTPEGTGPMSKYVKEDVYSLQDQINLEMGCEIVQVVEKDLTSEERYAYMWISSGIVISSIRDGLCLLPFEYIVVNRDKWAGIILSEFAGVSRALCSPRRVNPFDNADLENALFELMTQLPKPELLHKRKRDLAYINSKTTLRWARHFLTDLKRAHKDYKQYQYVSHGLGDKLKVIALRKNFSKLHTYNVLEAYKNSRNRVLFFDIEGTFTNLLKQTDIDKCKGPSDKILHIIDDLCQDERNTVFILTGRERRIVENWFKTVQFLGIAAEYGAFTRWNAKEPWEYPASTASYWKEAAMDIISAYATRTEGSFMVLKECSVVFQYRDAEREFGEWQAKELVAHLELLLKPFLNECELSEGAGYVEVKPRGINKGTTVYRILEKLYEKNGEIDFVLAVGDDISDEEMFRVIKLLKKQKSSLFASLKNESIFSCTLGIKPSLANYYVLDANEVIHLTEVLRSWSSKCKKNFSSGDLLSRNTLRHYTPIDMSVSPRHFFFESAELDDFSSDSDLDLDSSSSTAPSSKSFNCFTKDSTSLHWDFR